MQSFHEIKIMLYLLLAWAGFRIMTSNKRSRKNVSQTQKIKIGIRFNFHMMVATLLQPIDPQFCG